MKKISAADPDSPHSAQRAEKIYEFLNAVLTAKPATIIEAFGDEFINSLLQRCGLSEVFSEFSKNKIEL